MNRKRVFGECVYGVVRYAPDSGNVPEDDAAAFDGWYAIKAWADAVAKEWVEQYPHWCVAVVRQEWAHITDMDFGRSGDHPLTRRERHLVSLAAERGAPR
jgi:hypothetical protein